MKIVFLQSLWYEWQAPMIFSAIAKQKGHHTVMYIKSSPLAAARAVAEANADLVVFASIISGNMEYVYECAKQIKNINDIPIIVGGPQVSLFYHAIKMEYIDYLGIGEGEITFSCLLDALMNQESVEAIPGLAYMEGDRLKVTNALHIHSLDDIPVIDRDLYYRYAVFRNEKVRMFYSGRGCRYNCTYCCVPLLDKMDPSICTIRKRKVKSLLEEIAAVKKNYGLKAAFFQDDTFTQDRNWLFIFLRQYKKDINKPFMCLSRAADIDEEIAALFAETGCIGVGIGLESANEAVRVEMLNRMESNSQIANAIRILQNRNIKITTFNMIGIPGETQTHIENTIRFNNENKVDSAWGVLFQPYVNSELFHSLKRREDLSGNFYSTLGYRCPENRQLELIQKLFPLLVKYPRLKSVMLRTVPSCMAYLIFSVHSFGREIWIWKRSFFITLIVGCRNQFQYGKSKRARKGKI